MSNGLDDVTWGSESAFLRFGGLKVSFLSFKRPKVETKTKKILRIGESLASKRTAGIVEIGDIDAEMLATDYYSQILPRMPRHGGNLIEFQTTLNRRHPAVVGSYSILMDQCRIVSDEEEIKASEDGATIKMGISVMNVWEQGSDGLWKCKALLPTLPSSQAKALMNF